MSLTEQMTQLARQAKDASRALAKLSTAEKNSCLVAMAEALEKNNAAIRLANERDMTAGAASGLSQAMLDRLKLDDQRIAGMAHGLREVAALPDPVSGKPLIERLAVMMTPALSFYRIPSRRRPVASRYRVGPRRRRLWRRADAHCRRQGPRLVGRRITISACRTDRCGASSSAAGERN